MGEYKKINEESIKSAFEKVILKKDKVIILYSGVWSFINKLEFKNDIGKKILQIVESVVTKERTLIIPSFSAENFIKSKKFNIKKTIDRKNGIIANAALKANYYRTPQPLHSYLVFGKKVREVKKLKLLTSWGPTSILGWLSRNNARICVLGIPWNKGCSYLHRFEELYKVPWRYFKTYNGLLIKNNQKKYCFEKKYSSPKNGILRYDFNPFVKFLKTKNIFIKGKSDFFLESTTTNQIDNFSKIFYKKNKFWEIIKNKNEVKNWIKNNPN
tara:strand:+ start:48 stop:860 length:813 start_codon:yes stop_codon:yes gene_type:complete